VLFRLLGPTEAWQGGKPVVLGPPQQRAVLAVLALAVNQVVPVARLIDLLWDDDPPATARKNVQIHLHRLRRALADVPSAALLTRGPGYVLQADPGEIDVHVFRRLVDAARTADVPTRARLLREALSLWRGPALADVFTSTALRRIGAELDDERVAALEARVQADLDAGEHARCVAPAQELVAAHPLRERSWALLIRALHGTGRTSDALDAYRTMAKGLSEELGLDPSPELQDLHRRMLVGEPVQDSATPDRPRRPVPRELPADVTYFTGRTAELAELRSALPPRGAVTIALIDGPAGAGKTALGIRFAHETSEHFPDGQLYADLLGYAPGQSPMPAQRALDQFLRSMGTAPEDVPAGLTEKTALFRSLTADRRVLLLLDNAVSAEQVRPLVPGGSGCLVLVTSRNRLLGLVAREGAHRLALDLLTSSDATALLTRILGRHRVDAEPGFVGELARLCGHLPLALRIAAANVLARPQQSIAAAVLALGDENRLAALSITDDRHTAVRAAFSLSYDVLKPEQARLFRLLGTVPGTDFTLPAAASLLDCTHAQAAALLEDLVTAHLVEHHTPHRFRLHDLLRLYARELAMTADSPADRSHALQRLFHWYTNAADAATDLMFPGMVRLRRATTAGTAHALPFHDQEGAADWLETERHNIIALIHHAATEGPRPYSWYLVEAVRGFLRVRRHTLDWHSAATHALQAARRDHDRHAEAAMLQSVGSAAFAAGNYEDAASCFDAAVVICRELDAPAREATVLGNLGTTLVELGRLDEAVVHLDRARAIHRQLGNRHGEAVALLSLGLACWQSGRLADSVQHGLRARELCHEAGFPTGEVAALANLGLAHQELGQFPQAESQLRLALGLAREIGSRESEASIVDTLAMVHRDLGHHADATAHSNEALELVSTIEDNRVRAEALITAAGIAALLGRTSQALGQYREALERSRTSRYPRGEAEALLGLAETGDPREAVPAAQHALAIAQRVGLRVVEGRALATLALLELAGGHHTTALEHGRAAVALHRQTGHRLGEARALHIIGTALSRTGRTREAAEHLTRAAEIISEINAADLTQLPPGQA
jgi:DNA-binding SARP family transcriptional activator/Tfp pilus assembly protein PilF